MVVMKVKTTLSCTLLRDLFCNFSNEIVVTHNAMLTYSKKQTGKIDFSNESSSVSSDGSILEYDIDREERRKFTDIYDKTRICRETLKLGDEIQYYDPIAIVGDHHRLRTGIVTCLTPDSDYIVQVNTGDPIHSNRPVKRVRERNSKGDLVEIKQKCRMRTSAEFRCLAGGSTTAGITENVRQMTGIFCRTNNMLGMVGVSAVDLRHTPRTKMKQTSKDKRKNVSTLIYIVCVDQSIQESLMIQPLSFSMTAQTMMRMGIVLMMIMLTTMYVYTEEDYVKQQLLMSRSKLKRSSNA